MKKHNKNKFIAIMGLGILAVVGTYNAVMINSHSEIALNHPFKRLDEMYGVVKFGRAPAAPKPIIAKQIAPIKNEKIEDKITEADTKEIVAAVDEAVNQEELNMNLVEVVNPKWKEAKNFSGNIVANNGVIESLNAQLPDGSNIEIAFSEMNGNTFEYDLEGQNFAGMMYQVDQNAYVVTLTNGPLEGTRLRFAGKVLPVEEQIEQSHQYLAENHNVEVGNFGEEAQQPVSEPVAEVGQEVAQPQTNTPAFNFSEQTI